MANVNVIRDSGAEPQSAGPTLEREVAPLDERVGIRSAARSRSRLFAYDRAKGLGAASYRFSVTKTDRMSESEAANMLERIHAAYGLEHLEEDFYYDFDTALFLCYALNGASQLVASDRAIFTVRGSEYDYRTVCDLTGVAMRRFFRAYADEVVGACRFLHDHYDPFDVDQAYMRELMIQLADDRNVYRAPWLIADCAEAATCLDATERAIIAMSKQSVIGATYNAVDRRKIGVPVRSLDNFDSSNMASIPNAYDINAAQPAYHN